MGIIKKLDQKTTNLIAAGEVVERPASVVKELVENSIDAKAKNIKIKLVDSGLKEITITDDGVGMDAADAKLATIPHATSKIKDGNDLFRITTLGFRGEALPSIAAVSNFVLKTSDNEARGIKYTMRNGRIIDEEIIARSQGSEISVKNLFYNTPARLQNLQSPATELSHISDFITKISLAHPDISFSLVNNDRDIIQTYGNNNLREVVLSVYGNNVARNMLAIQGKNNYYKISGLISNIDVTRSTKRHINIIVNKRIIRDYKIVNAISRAYDGYLMGGRFPIAIINIEVDPGLIDVNIHPSKLEIRFANEKELMSLLNDVITNKLFSTNLTTNKDSFEEFVGSNEDSNNDINTEFDSFNFKVDDSKGFEIDSSYLEEKPTEIEKFNESFQQQKYTFIDNEITDGSDNKIPKMDYIGQLFGTYILTQADEHFYLIDQHAAAERVNFEKILKQLKQDSYQSYELLIPIQLDFSPSETVLVNQHFQDINNLGIEIEYFGKNSFTIRKIPDWISRGKEQGFIEEIITHIIYNYKKEKYEFQTNLAKDLACKRSIKANEYHSAIEIEDLLDKLARADNPYTCPHGRPVIIKYSKYEIEKWFKRIV